MTWVGSALSAVLAACGVMDGGMDVVDIGPDPTRRTLPWFSALEQSLIADRSYPRDVVDNPDDDTIPLDCVGG